MDTTTVPDVSHAFRPADSGGYPHRMTGEVSNESGFTRSDRRRLRRGAIEERARKLAERDAFLESVLEPDEGVVARRPNHPLVTDRRILDARQLVLPPRRGEWVLDAVPFGEVTGWAPGERHDHRPIVKLEHHRRTRIDHLTENRFLWFRWGNAEGPVTYTTTIFSFGRRTNPVLLAMRTELERRRIPQGPAFAIRPAGTREERTKGSRRVLYRSGGTAWFRFRLWRATDVLYRGELAWPVRAVGWLVLGVPAWFVSPWLVPATIVAAELAWIVALQWMWHRHRARRGSTS
jgi:hypothetical protein